MGYEDWQQVYRIDSERYVIGAGPNSKEAYLIDFIPAERAFHNDNCTCSRPECSHRQAATVAQAYFATLDKVAAMTQEDFAAFYEKWWGARKAKMAAQEEGSEKYYKLEAFYVALGEAWRLRRKPEWRDVDTVMGGVLGYLFEQKEGE